MKKVLTIPGIGDIHWVMLKMQSWIEKNCPGEIPEIWVWNFDGRQRSADFVKRIPFVKFGGYLNETTDMDRRAIRHSYMTGKMSEAFNFHGFDCYLCVNGQLRVGHNMDRILPQYAVNWDYPIDLTGIQRTIKDPYIIFYFSDHGMFSEWVKHASAERIKELLKTIPKEYRIILTGSKWDFPFNEKIAGGRIENACGETTFYDLLGLIVNASAFVGWCGGNTIISQHLGTPTLMLWSNYFDKKFQTNWVHPEKIGNVYIPMNVENLTNEKFTESLDKLLSHSKIKDSSTP